MRLVFFDATNWDYDINTALEVGLGGSQSALCYLAVELRQRGQDVAVINGVPHRRTSHDVQFFPRSDPASEVLVDTCDAMIVLNAALGVRLRETGIKCPLVLWQHHDANQPAAEPLKNPEERAQWNRIVFLTEWQRERYRQTLRIENAEIIGNAVAPPFLEQEVRTPWFETGRPPVCAYASTPFRGLSELLDCWLEIRSEIPGVRLKVYSDMRLYQVSDHLYASLYERCRRMEGVEYIGSIGQRALAKELARCDYLTYPNTFDETFCIVASEAAAVGCVPIVPPNGALPETLGSAAIWALRDFPATVIDALRHPEIGHQRRQQAIARLRTECTWAKRAVEWERLLWPEPE